MTNNTKNSSSDKFKVGLIGVGNWANHGHLRVLDLLPEYEVVAVQARRIDAARSAAERFGISNVAGMVDELLALPDVNVVAVLNTAPQHADTVRAVIAVGKDVYCEWPLTVSTPIAEELAWLAHNAGVRHVVGLQRRLAPHNRCLRDLLADGFVGKLRSFRMHVSMNYFRVTRSAALKWTAPPENFSSVAANYGGHFLDMLFQAMGWPRKLSAMPVNQFPEISIAGTNEKVASAVLELANLYVAFARDRATGSHDAPTFDDAVHMHRFFDLFEQSTRDGQRVQVA